MQKLNQYIHCHNELNRIAKIEIENVLKQLPKYVGKKIFLRNGGKATAFSIEFMRTEPAPLKVNGVGHASIQNMYLEESYNKLRLVIDLSFSWKETPTAQCSISHYHGWKYELGNMSTSDGTLIELFDLEKVIQDHGLNNVLNEQEEQARINKYDEVLAKLEAIRATIKAPSEYIPKYSTKG